MDGKERLIIKTIDSIDLVDHNLKIKQLSYIVHVTLDLFSFVE